jgi:osmotically-inducible protein OsmY
MLANAVVDQLIADPELVGAEIEIAVQNRVVILAGHAPSPEVRIRAGDSAWQVTGVFDVCNLIKARN